MKCKKKEIKKLNGLKTGNNRRLNVSKSGKIENNYERKRFQWDYLHVFREELIHTLVNGLDRTMWVNLEEEQ